MSSSGIGYLRWILPKSWRGRWKAVGGAGCEMQGGIGGSVLDSWYMYHFKARVIFEVVKPRVTYLIQGFISKVFQEGFVVNHDDEVVASQNKVFDLVKGIHYSQGLSLNWCISGFCSTTLTIYINGIKRHTVMVL